MEIPGHFWVEINTRPGASVARNAVACVFGYLVTVFVSKLLEHRFSLIAIKLLGLQKFCHEITPLGLFLTPLRLLLRGGNLRCGLTFRKVVQFVISLVLAVLTPDRFRLLFPLRGGKLWLLRHGLLRLYFFIHARRSLTLGFVNRFANAPLIHLDIDLVDIKIFDVDRRLGDPFGNQSDRCLADFVISPVGRYPLADFLAVGFDNLPFPVVEKGFLLSLTTYLSLALFVGTPILAHRFYPFLERGNLSRSLGARIALWLAK
jgi:hypothetical protein